MPIMCKEKLERIRQQHT